MSVMSDFSKRVNSIIVKNLPTDFDKERLEEIFSQYGKISSSRIIPSSGNSEGMCGFINYADGESCNQAVEKMHNHTIKGFTLSVTQSTSRSNDRPTQNGLNTRPVFSATNSIEENNGTLSPNIQSRSSSFRPVGDRSTKITLPNSLSSSANELNTISNGTKSLWNQQSSNSISPISTNNIDEHEPFVKNRIYQVYLSNLEVPNIVFAATLDDYVNATLLITQMNKHEQLSKVQANSYKSKLNVGQLCAALFNNDWYRARVLEIGENRVRVRYIDWGNTGWCDSTLGVRPLPNEYYKDPALCMKCILDGIPSNEKLSDEQSNAILNILVLDVKLELTVIRIENGVPYVRLNLCERNLNNEIREHLPSSALIKPNQIINFDANKLELNHSETHCVQLTTVDPQSECFHVLIMKDYLATIMNTLKDWNGNKQPFIHPPKSNMLVCAQYDIDDLWYRGWIEKITDKGYHVYFVDFGNEEIVSSDRLTECPDILRNIPWQSIQIKLANITLTDDERYLLIKEFETERLDMKIIQKYQDIYLVDLFDNNKSLVEYIFELRKKQPPPPAQIKSINNDISQPKISTEPIVDLPKPPVFSNNNKVFQPTINPISNTEPSIDDLPKPPVFSNSNKIFQPTTNPVSNTEPPSIDLPKPPVFSNSNKLFQSITNQISNTESPTVDLPKPPVFSSNNKPIQATTNQSSNTDDYPALLLAEQRRQTHLLQQILAAINTNNALLTQLVQR